MQETISQILDQHNKIVKHFFTLQERIHTLQENMHDLAKTITLIGFELEEVRRSLHEKNKNNNLQP